MHETEVLCESIINCSLCVSSYIYTARMGNPKAALELIIDQLQDVDKVRYRIRIHTHVTLNVDEETHTHTHYYKAIEFAMEEGDEDLWEVLISLSIKKPSML